MVRDGLVERRRRADDRRVTEIFLIDRGRGLRPDLQEAAETLIRTMFAPLSPDQYTQLRETVDLLREHLAA